MKTECVFIVEMGAIDVETTGVKVGDIPTRYNEFAMEGNYGGF